MRCNKFDQVDESFKKALENLDSIDGVINFSGSILLKAAHQTKEEEYLDTIHKNLTTSFAITKAAGKHLKNPASIVFFSSVAAQIGVSNHEAIAAAKAGVEGLTRSAACTYSGKNLRFNAIAPSLTQTNLSKNLTSNEMMLKASNAMHATGKIGQPKDIVKSCLFLLDPENDWFTGQILGVEGGFKLKTKVKL